MRADIFFRGVPQVGISRLWHEGPTLHVAGHSTRRWARCPLCGRRSRQVRGHYERTLADLPCGGDPVRIHLRVRRFACRARPCRRRIFTERLPELAAPAAHRTARLQAHLARVGFDLGVDDWAFRRGCRYGTILVDLEAHRVVDLLPDRTAATLAAWLRGHPEVAIISRDRASAYAEGARLGAPQARQVADRFHLIMNLTERFLCYLTRMQATRGRPELPAPAGTRPVGAGEVPRTREARGAADSRARRQARCRAVRTLAAQGVGIGAVAAQLGMGRHAAARLARAACFPERRPRAPGPTALQPFHPYLSRRRQEGCRNATGLWREIRAQGYAGSPSAVVRHLQAARAFPGQPPDPAATPPAAPALLTPRQHCWLLLGTRTDRTAAERASLDVLHARCPQVAVALALVQEFRTVLREQNVPGFYRWLRGVESAAIPELCSVARGIWSDRHAVEAAVALPWSQGQTEGQVNRIKTLKRQMYGRATFALLRCRMLHPA